MRPTLTTLTTLLTLLLLTATAGAQPTDPARDFAGEFTLRGGAQLRDGDELVHAGALLRVRHLVEGQFEVEREGFVLTDPPTRRRWTASVAWLEGGVLNATFPLARSGLVALGEPADGGTAHARYWFDASGVLVERIEDAGQRQPWTSIWGKGRPLSRGTAEAGAETLVDHGPSDARYDLVITSDGYTAAELPRFHAEARQVVDRLRATSPFSHYWSYVNVHRVDVASAGSGIPGGRGGPAALGTTLEGRGRQRSNVPGGDRGRIFDAVAAAPGADAVLVLVNDHFRSVAHVDFTFVSALDPDFAAVAVHELGHTIGFLLDEYEELPSTPWDFVVANGLVEGVAHWGGWGANLTTTRAREEVPWRAWLPPGVPLPTPDGSGHRVGLYEGGMHFERGWFRPSETCLMRDTQAEFCVVCREALVLRLSKRTRPYEVIVDRVDRDTVRLSVRSLVPGPARVSWVRNGLVSVEGPTYQVSRRRLPWGESDLELIVEDRTPWVRHDRLGWATFRARFRLWKGWLWNEGVKVEGPWPVAPREVEGEDLFRKLDRG